MTIQSSYTSRSLFSSTLDYALYPLYVLLPVCAAWMLLLRGVPNLLVTPIVVGVLAAITLVLERVRPERLEPTNRDLPLTTEAAHFLFNFEFGYGVALGAIKLIEYVFRIAFPAPWPTHWPVVLQLLLAVFFYELLSYWQHRWLHERARWWHFHALHHSGAYLDMFRGVRFHCVDFCTAAFTAYLPFALLGTSENIITMVAVLVSALGMVQHGNFRVRTPSWLDWIVCTPAVHRRHHSRQRAEHDANYANTLMCFDLLFGTFAKPDPVGPARMGLEEDPLPTGFWAQFFSPFTRARATNATP